MVTSFVVHIDIYADPDDPGVEYILPSERDLRRQESFTRARESEADAAKAAGEDKKETAALASRAKAARRLLEEQTRLRRTLLGQPGTRRESYTLLVPTYGKVAEAEANAREMTEYGPGPVDPIRYMNALFPHAVEGMTPEQVFALKPDVASLLWLRLKHAIRPDVNELFITPSSAAKPSADRSPTAAPSAGSETSGSGDD